MWDAGEVYEKKKPFIEMMKVFLWVNVLGAAGFFFGGIQIVAQTGAICWLVECEA